jgi:hypothetical protein
MYDNYMVYGLWGVGESCHESQWVYGVGNMYAYTTTGNLIHSEGPSPLGIRTFFYNCTFLSFRDADWCSISEETHLNLTQFWNNNVHSPSATSTGHSCPNGGNTTFVLPMLDADATIQATRILAPYPKG